TTSSTCICICTFVSSVFNENSSSNIKILNLGCIIKTSYKVQFLLIVQVLVVLVLAKCVGSNPRVLLTVKEVTTSDCRSFPVFIEFIHCTYVSVQSFSDIFRCVFVHMCIRVVPVLRGCIGWRDHVPASVRTIRSLVIFKIIHVQVSCKPLVERTLRT